MRHLIIPDAHAQPDVDNRRFEWLGKFIADTQPEVIVNIGDFADMESLSSYDKGTKAFEGRRYKRDIEATRDALHKLHAPMDEYNENAARLHRKRYKPRMVITVGNHEARIDRVTNLHPELDGTISIKDLGYEEFGWEVHPYRTVVTIDGIAYSHYFASGVMGRPVSGLHQAYSLIQKRYTAATQGHTHTLDYKCVSNGDGKRIQGLVCGCFLDPEQTEDYAGEEVNNMWWRGIIVKHITSNGYDPEFISIERLQEMYG